MLQRILDLIGLIIAMYIGSLLGYYIYSVYEPAVPKQVRAAIGIDSILYLGLALAAIAAVFVHIRKR